MNLYGNYKSRLGYQTGENQIDSYGVDHSGFSTHDELEYQFARQEREKQITENLNRQGIEPENYPQLGNRFWGTSSDNNYGFGSSNIHDNIENRENQTEQTGLVKQFGNYFGNAVEKYGIDKIMTSLYNLGYDIGERVSDYINGISKNPNEYDNLSSVGKAENEASRLTPIKISDINKHQYVSCIGAFDGPFATMATGAAGVLKEGNDLYNKWNNPRYGTNLEIIQDSLKDLKNNAIGLAKGLSSSDINECRSLLPANTRKRIY